MSDRVTELRIDGLRSIEGLKLRLDGLTVLIGENGSGKSSIIEACQILRAAARPEFSRAFHGIHGGMFSLLRRGSNLLHLGARIEGDDGPPLEYDLTLTDSGGTAIVHSETLISDADGSAQPLIERPNWSEQLNALSRQGIYPHAPPSLLLRRPEQQTELGSVDPRPEVQRMRAALEQIEVHVPFEVNPLWAARARKRSSALRSTTLVQHADRLDLFGDELPNVYRALANDFGEAHWQETLGYIRLGLDQDVERVTIQADPGGGAIALGIEVRGLGRLPTAALSDGELAYLAFVALYRLESPRSLLAFDEPDLHLHPGLLVRIMQFFQALSEKHPVLLATHSDTVLDCLEDPVRSVRVCELEQPQRRTVLRSLDAEALASWLRDYRGVGHIRGDGYLSQVLKDE
jgi:predicted ATPase